MPLVLLLVGAGLLFIASLGLGATPPKPAAPDPARTGEDGPSNPGAPGVHFRPEFLGMACMLAAIIIELAPVK